jgi:hypothetical protein
MTGQIRSCHQKAMLGHSPDPSGTCRHGRRTEFRHFASNKRPYDTMTSSTRRRNLPWRKPCMQLCRIASNISTIRSRMLTDDPKDKARRSAPSPSPFPPP